MNDSFPPEVIDLKHIRLRRPRVTDASDIFEYGSDLEVAYYADWKIRTSVDAIVESIVARGVLWAEGAEFNWVITKVEDDRAIGGLSCKVAGNSAEIGFLLNKRFWNKGYATSAAGAVVNWLQSVPLLAKVWATCDAENVASICVLKKIGFVEEAVLQREIIRPQISNEPRDAMLFSYRLTEK